MKIIILLSLIFQVSLSFANSLKTIQSIIPLDKNQNSYVGHQLILQKNFKQLLDDYNSKSNKNQMESSQYQLSLKKEKYFTATFKWKIHFKSTQKDTFLPLIPKSWVLINKQSINQYQEGSNHLNLAITKQMKGEVQFLVKPSSLLELPPIPLTKIKIINGLGFSIKNPSNKNHTLTLTNNDSFAVGGLNYIQFFKTPLKPKVVLVTKNKKNPLKSIVNSQMTALKASILSKPLYQIDIKKNELLIQGKLNINVLHQKIYSLSHSFSKDFQLKRLTFKPSIPFLFNDKEIIFPDGFMGQISLNFIQSIPKKSLVDGFHLPSLTNATLFKGVLYFISSENVEISSIKNEQLIALPYLNDQSLDSHNLPILKSFEFYKQLGAIQLKTKIYPQQKSSQLKVLNTHVSSIITEEFRLANSYSFKVLNLGASSFVFNIPPQVQFLGSYINNKPVKPFRNDQAQIAINLPKDKNLTIAIKTLESLSSSKQLSLYLPTKEKSLETNWDFYYPKGLDVRPKSSNLNFQKIEYTTPIKNYANYVLSQFFQSSLSTFQIVIIIFVPLILLGLTIQFLLWIYKKFSSNAPLSTFKKVMLFILFIGGFFFLAILSSMSFMGGNLRPEMMARVNFQKPKSNFSGYKQNNIPIMELQEEADSFSDDFDGIAMANKSIAEGKIAPRPPSRLLGRSNKRSSALKKDQRRQKNRRDYKESSWSSKVRSSIKKYKRKPLKREIKSKYKKIRKSGVKPVEIQFPKLSNIIKFQKKTPIDGLIYIQLTINKAKSNSFLLTSSLFSFLYLAIFIYLEKKEKLILLAFLSILMILSPAGQFMFMRPEPLFIVIAIILINSISRVCKNSIVFFVALLLFNSSEASKQRYQNNPDYKKVFQIFDFKNNDFSYKNQILVQDQLINQLTKKQNNDIDTTNILSQSLIIKPNFKEQKIFVIYTFNLASSHAKNFTLLKINNKTLISKCFDENYEAVSLNKSSKYGYSKLNVENFDGETILLFIELPMKSQNYGDDFYSEVPISTSLQSSIMSSKKDYYLKIKDTVFINNSYYTSSKNATISLHFSRHPFIKKEVESPTFYHQNKINTINKVQQVRKSKINFYQKILFSDPYIIVNNRVSISHKKKFKLRLEKNTTLSQFNIKRNYKSLKQGQDFSLKLENNYLNIELKDNSKPVLITYRYFQKKSKNSFHLPFHPKQFKENIFKLEKELKEGQEINFTLNEALRETASNSFQRKVLEFENIPQHLSQNTQFSVEIKSKSFVSFSKTKCLSYKIENFLISKKEIYQKLVLTLTNKESQFLELKLPKGTILEEALIDGKHLNIVKKDSLNLLLPLKKYKRQRQFKITLLLKAKLNFKDDKYQITLPKLKTDIKNLYFALTTHKNMYKFSDENPIRIQQKYNLNGFTQMVTSSNSFQFKFPRGKYFYVGARNGVESEIAIEFEEIKEKKEIIKNEIEYTPLFFIFIIAVFFQLSLSSPKLKITLSFVALFLIPSFSGGLQYFYILLLITYLGYINNKSELD
ncbi:MAG: hypothetical protein COB02_02950 [Candidatus Cloacimonadota bacterium]|nr:MAG: hypothetical protein COB02_02950 [Candidatus Cloacimonadota bacterium]